VTATSADDRRDERTVTEILRETRATYTAHALTYAAMTRSYQPFPGLQDEIASFVAGVVEGMILDVGTGSGRDAAWAASLGRVVVLADASMGMLRHATTHTAAAAAVCCDVLTLPFRDEVFAGIIASGVLVHLPKSRVRKALREIYRILRGGGRGLISMKRGHGEGWHQTEDFPARRWFAFYQPDELTSACVDAGLTVLSVDLSHRRDWFTARVERTR
jgi:SAM-dependent methyltransferase